MAETIDVTTSAPRATSSLTLAIPVGIAVTTSAPVPTCAARLTARQKLFFAEVDLNDPAIYHGGYKRGGVLSFHPVRRGLSDRQGQMEHMSFGAILDDAQGEWRQLLDQPQTKYLINQPIEQWIVDDEVRRQLGPARLVANGFIGDYSPLPNRRFRIDGQDWMKRIFARYANAQTTWQPRITAADFPVANNGSQQTVGQIIPIIYGRITDSQEIIVGAGLPNNDFGDGQLIPIYVGDYTIAGNTWRGALICAHYGEIEAAFSVNHQQGVDLESDPDWLTPLNGPAWLAAGFYRPFMTLNSGQEVTMIFVKGADGDAFVANPTDGNAGIAVNVSGRTDTGDDEGDLLTDGFDILYDFLRNYVAPQQVWKSGPPLPVPKFTTLPGISMISLASFNRCREEVLTRLTEGYPLNFALGAGNTSWRLSDVMAEFHKCLDVEACIDHAGRYQISMEPQVVPAVTKPALRDGFEIIKDGFSIEDKNTDFSNVLPYVHTFDYCGRMQAQFSTPWRSQMSGASELRHQGSIDAFEQEKPAATLEFQFIRGKNRFEDPDHYQAGTDAALDIAQRVLNRSAFPRRRVHILTSLNGTSHEPGDIAPVTTPDGVGVTGWNDRNIRFTGHELMSSKGQVLLDGYDFDGFLESLVT